MNYKIIDMEKYYRKGVFEHFSKDCKCRISMTVKLDVTKLVEYSKETKTKFYLNFLYLLCKTLNSKDDYKMYYEYHLNELRCYDTINPIQYVFFEESKTYYHIKEKEKRKKWKQVKIDETDIIANNDLRILLPQIYGGEVKKFDGYIAMTCFAHNDQKPSMMVKKSHYWCTACGEKGNIWTLIKKHKSIKYDEVK